MHILQTISRNQRKKRHRQTLAFQEKHTGIAKSKENQSKNKCRGSSSPSHPTARPSNSHAADDITPTTTAEPRRSPRSVGERKTGEGKKRSLPFWRSSENRRRRLACCEDAGLPRVVCRRVRPPPHTVHCCRSLAPPLPQVERCRSVQAVVQEAREAGERKRHRWQRNEERAIEEVTRSHLWNPISLFIFFSNAVRFDASRMINCMQTWMGDGECWVDNPVGPIDFLNSSKGQQLSPPCTGFEMQIVQRNCSRAPKLLQHHIRPLFSGKLQIKSQGSWL